MVIIKQYDDGLVVRLAEARDKEAVLGMDIFSGMDYVWGLYDYMLENPDWYGFVGVVNDTVIAFAFICLVDNGRSVVRGGKRVHESFRGRGYLARFIDPLEDYVTARHPEVTSWRYTSQNGAYQQKHVPKLREAGALQVMTQKSYSFFDATVGALKKLKAQAKHLSEELGIHNVTVYPGPDVPSSLLDPSTREAVFPEGRIISYSIPVNYGLEGFQAVMSAPWFKQCNITFSGDEAVTSSGGESITSTGDGVIMSSGGEVTTCSDREITTSSDDIAKTSSGTPTYTTGIQVTTSSTSKAITSSSNQATTSSGSGRAVTAVNLISCGASGPNTMMVACEFCPSANLTDRELDACWKLNILASLLCDWPPSFPDDLNLAFFIRFPQSISADAVPTWLRATFPDMPTKQREFVVPPYEHIFVEYNRTKWIAATKCS